VCIDGSEPSKRAVILASRVVRPTDKVTVFTVGYTDFSIPGPELTEMQERQRVVRVTCVCLFVCVCGFFFCLCVCVAQMCSIPVRVLCVCVCVLLLLL
jgi:hypothetical protein